jgi:hypothetical protein
MRLVSEALSSGRAWASARPRADRGTKELFHREGRSRLSKSWAERHFNIPHFVVPDQSQRNSVAVRAEFRQSRWGLSESLKSIRSEIQ